MTHAEGQVKALLDWPAPETIEFRNGMMARRMNGADVGQCPYDQDTELVSCQEWVRGFWTERARERARRIKDREASDAAWAYFMPLIGLRVTVPPHIFPTVRRLHQGPMEVINVERRPLLGRPGEFSRVLSVVMRCVDGVVASINHTDVNWRVPAVTERTKA